MFKSENRGERIKALRKKLNLNQNEFVKDLNIKRSALSQIETGRLQPSLELITNIVRKYKVTYTWIIDGIPQDFLNDKFSNELQEVLYNKIPKEQFTDKKSIPCKNCEKYIETIVAQKETIRALNELSLYLKGQLEKCVE